MSTQKGFEGWGTDRPCDRCRGEGKCGPWGDSDHDSDAKARCNVCAGTGVVTTPGDEKLLVGAFRGRAGEVSTKAHPLPFPPHPLWPPIETKPTNPKDIVGSDKLPLHLWPTTATALGCLGFLDGALKYGRSNFRATGVRASIYVDACKRHLDAWFEGEENDPDSGLPHLAHALACIAIIVDASAAGKLNDDRMFEGGYRKLVSELTPHVARVKELRKDHAPKHYTKGTK